IGAAQRADGTIYLDYLGWNGAPDVMLTRPQAGGTMWRRAWVDGVDQAEYRYPEPYRLVQNRGMGLLIQGTREWTDYRVSAAISPHMVQAAGIGARVQGLRRYYALLLAEGGVARLVKALDGETVLAETDVAWQCGGTYNLSLQVMGHRLQAWIDGRLLFDVENTERPLTGGGVALICEEGRMSSDAVTVRPVEQPHRGREDLP
ncbi:MAG TPA: ADP-ribosylglycohydrolase family protein, partial [Chloroflexota bacterium]|nr:ADP-ribosylglycohydrolase family protein [Chloroflexota bacterium]